MNETKDCAVNDYITIYYKFDTGYGQPIHIHITKNNGKVTKVFTHTTPYGTEISGLTNLMGLLITKYLEVGGDINKIKKYLNSVKTDHPFGFGDKRIESIPHAVCLALNRCLEKEQIGFSSKMNELLLEKSSDIKTV